jgi:hypothetical protein
MYIVTYKNVYCYIQECILLYTRMYTVIYKNVYCYKQECILLYTRMYAVIYKNVCCYIQASVYRFCTSYLKLAICEVPLSSDTRRLEVIDRDNNN